MALVDHAHMWINLVADQLQKEGKGKMLCKVNAGSLFRDAEAADGQSTCPACLLPGGWACRPSLEAEMEQHVYIASSYSVQVKIACGDSSLRGSCLAA